jgi:hypothetical protein
MLKLAIVIASLESSDGNVDCSKSCKSTGGYTKSTGGYTKTTGGYTTITGGYAKSTGEYTTITGGYTNISAQEDTKLSEVGYSSM